MNPLCVHLDDLQSLRIEGEYEDMKKSFIAIAVAAIMGVGLAATSSAPATAGAAATGTITVTGSGSATVKRDQATTSLSVTYLASTAKQAMSQTTAAYNAVRAAMLDAGVKADNLTTSGINLYPQYEWNSKENQSVLTGYRATVSVSVVSTVALAATVLDVAVSTGGDAVSIGGISFDTANPEAATDATRVKAVQNAKAKARDYAEALGQSVGKAVKIVETSAAVPVPIYSMAKAAADSVGTVNMDSGTQKVTSTVTVTFELLG